MPPPPGGGRVLSNENVGNTRREFSKKPHTGDYSGCGSRFIRLLKDTLKTEQARLLAAVQERSPWHYTGPDSGRNGNKSVPYSISSSAS